MFYLRITRKCPRQHKIALDLLSRGIIKGKDFIIHHFSLDEIKEAFKTAEEHQGLKVIVKKMKIKLSASIVCANFSHLEKDIRILEKERVDYLHFDIMDGHFVPNPTMGPGILASLRKITDLPFDTHLMIENPHRYIPTFVEAGSTFISVHVETCPHLDRTIRLIKEKGAKARVALNPVLYSGECIFKRSCPIIH